jgi:peptide/nickel transport system substrate-binding protein
MFKYRLCAIGWLLLAGLMSCQQQVEKRQFFRYNQASGLNSLDPAFAKDQSSVWACNQLYNSLLQLDDSLNIRPCIASTWETSADKLTITFHLRTDVLFHDDACFAYRKGRRVTAADFVFSFSRLMDKHVASPGAWIFNNSVDTTEPFKAINDSTFQIKLIRPFRPILGMLAMQYCSVIPQEAIKKYGGDFRAHPVGTGPFMYKNWMEGTALILVRNPHYFEKDSAGNALPYLQGIKVSFIDNKKTEYLSFKQGELDFMNSIDAGYIDEVLDDSGKLKPELQERFNLQKSPYLNTEYLGFLMTTDKDGKNVFANKKLRQAINYAFDRREMLRYLRKNVGLPAESGFTPYGLPSFDAEKVKGYNYDVVKAKQLLKEAGFGNGVGLGDIHLYTNDTYKEYALFISHQLQQIGIHLKVEVVQPAILREWMSAGKVQFFRGSWLADYPDAENYFAVFYSKNAAPPNYTRFNNREFDRIYEQALAEDNDSIRYAEYHQLDNIIIDEAPVVPLYYDQVLRFTQKHVSGLGCNALNLLDLRRVRVE